MTQILRIQHGFILCPSKEICFIRVIRVPMCNNYFTFFILSFFQFTRFSVLQSNTQKSIQNTEGAIIASSRMFVNSRLANIRHFVNFVTPNAQQGKVSVFQFMRFSVFQPKNSNKILEILRGYCP